MDAKLIKNAVLGLAVGDAFGMPYETGKRGEYDVYADASDGQGGYVMRGYKKGMPAHWYEDEMPAGIWTDDTAMVLAELESISRLGRIDPEDMMNNFCKWHFEGEFTPYGKSIGQGRRTVAALEKYRGGAKALECGGADEQDNGNGSLMRMLPFAFVGPLMESSGVTVRELSALTHAHEYSTRSCEVYVEFARRLLEGMDKHSITGALGDLGAPLDKIKNIEHLTEDEIKSSVFVVESLEAALWCFLNTDNYEDCIMKAINLGGDTDTIAAIAGGLAGMCYPVPEKWIDQLMRKDYITEMCDRFINAIK
ncbi:MAG: ADP-ribosylglycohydrolase family protein [Oscillospiraceae bacterium]|nr:ADP-ribosylglycohydrolase family protein [Oscillospiraceae bacterium]